jgi:hypothetical protein
MRGKEKAKNGARNYGERAARWHKPLAKSDKINLSGSFELYWADIEVTLKLTFNEYLKRLEELFDGSLYLREAWVCRMFRQKKFDQLFIEPDLLGNTKQGREQCHDYAELLDRIYLATRALLKFHRNLKSEIEPKQRAKLSRADITLARERFEELTQEGDHLSKNQAYEIIAEELSKRKREKISKIAVRRACDAKFAEQSHCRYETTPQKETNHNFEFDPAAL